MRRLPIFGLALALSAAACQQESTTPAAVGDTPVLPADNVLYNLHHVMTRNGVRTSVLDADTAYQRDESQTLDLIGVHLTFFTETGAESGTLTAKTGSYSVDTGEFSARDSVVLVTRTPTGTRRIETAMLNYHVKNDLLWSDAPFVMTEGGRTTRGSSFRSDRRAGTVTVNDAVTSGGIPQGEAEAGVSF